MLLFSPKWLFLVPALMLPSLGLVGFILLLPGPITMGNVRFDTNTLLVCSMMVLLGVQAVSFAVNVKVFAIREGLLASDRRIRKLLDSHPIERGLVLGFLFLLLGMGYLIFALYLWRETGFWNLNYPTSLRIVIPAVMPQWLERKTSLVVSRLLYQILVNHLERNERWRHGQVSGEPTMRDRTGKSSLAVHQQVADEVDRKTE